MRQYEVTFIVDPVLSGDEIKEAAQTYVDLIGNENNKIVHVDEMGLRQLAYPINKRTSGVYYCVEFQNEEGSFIPKMELAFRRDERIMRFLTVKLDKYGVKYNDDKRNGLIGKKRAKEAPKAEKTRKAPVRAASPSRAKSEEE
jgi:small subunit ribosomal protein S6